MMRLTRDAPKTNRKERKMMKNNNASNDGGMGFFSVLQIVFIVLKLCGVIDWKWGWVLSPTWGSIIFYVVIVIIYAAISTRRNRH